MAQQSTAAAADPTAQVALVPQASAPLTVLSDGSVLYKTLQQAQAAGHTAATGAPAAGVKKLSQASYGESYLGRDGQAVPLTLGDLAQFQVTGFLVVLGAMAGLYFVWSFLSRLLRDPESEVSPQYAPAAARPAVGTSALPEAAGSLHPGLSDQELVVILSAAAFEMLNAPVRIVKVSRLNPRDASNWAAEGRSVLHSHRLK